MTTTATHPRPIGYICKKCGDVAPEGVGYISREPAAVQRSATTVSCACGYSQRP